MLYLEKCVHLIQNYEKILNLNLKHNDVLKTYKTLNIQSLAIDDISIAAELPSFTLGNFRVDKSVVKPNDLQRRMVLVESFCRRF